MNEDAKILIVEDDSTIRTLLGMALDGAGYKNVASVSRGDEAVGEVRRFAPDLVILDLMLPGLDGCSIARIIRSDPDLAMVRIIMLTALSSDEDIVRGLEAGADDYIAKPFERKVMLARVRAVLRRGMPVQDGVDFDGLTVDSVNRRVRLAGKNVDLTAGEYSLLTRLLSYRGRIFPRAADERTIDVQVVGLRKKLGAWARHIETVRGVGYRVE